MADQNGNLIPAIPPLFGTPKERNVNIQSNRGFDIQLVAIDDQDNKIDKLQIQTIPLEIQVQPIANWAIIPSIGRNNPFYQYTGGEDIIKFTLDWYSNTESKTDVINACRKVESWSRANGYRKEPPRIIVIFGELYKYTTWILVDAPYTLSLFNREKDLLPQQAYQEITLKKVTKVNSAMKDRQLIG